LYRYDKDFYPASRIAEIIPTIHSPHLLVYDTEKVMIRHTSRSFYIMPLVAGSVAALSLFALVNATVMVSSDIRSFAKKKSCADYGSAAARNACLGNSGQTPSVCPAGMTPCGATNSCLSAAACVAAGAAIQEKKDRQQDEEPAKQTTTASTTVPSIIPSVTTTPPPIALTTPMAKLSNNRCPVDLFKCTCGCYSASQFRKASTDACSVMCGLAAPKTTVPPAKTVSVSPSVSPVNPSVSPRVTVLVTPRVTPSVPASTARTLPYYSQVDPGWADNKIPGTNSLYVTVGCGEVSVANILTHAGIPTNPDEASKQYKGGLNNGTEYNQNITVLTKNGFQADPYVGSFKNLTSYMGENDVLWLTVRTNKSGFGHHTYIDGYTMEDGQPVYNLRDPYFGTNQKCVTNSDRGFACDNGLTITAPPDTDNSGQGTVALLLTPPEN